MSFKPSPTTVKRMTLTVYPLHSVYDIIQNLIGFSQKMFLFLFWLRCTAYIVKDNAKIFTSMGLPCKDVILFSKKLYMFNVVYVKSNKITC